MRQKLYFKTVWKSSAANIYLTKGIYCQVDFPKFLEADHYSSNCMKGSLGGHTRLRRGSLNGSGKGPKQLRDEEPEKYIIG